MNLTFTELQKKCIMNNIQIINLDGSLKQKQELLKSMFQYYKYINNSITVNKSDFITFLTSDKQHTEYPILKYKLININDKNQFGKINNQNIVSNELNSLTSKLSTKNDYELVNINQYGGQSLLDWLGELIRKWLGQKPVNRSSSNSANLTTHVYQPSVDTSNWKWSLINPNTNINIEISEDRTMTSINDTIDESELVICGDVMTKGAYYWEVLIKQCTHECDISFGVANYQHIFSDANIPKLNYFISGIDGSIYNESKLVFTQSDTEKFKQGDRIGCWLNFDDGSLFFYRNGEPYRDGFTEGVTGELIIGVELSKKNDAVEIIHITPL